MSLRKRTASAYVAVATACSAPAPPPPAESPDAAPVAAPPTGAPFRREVVVIKEQGISGDGAPAEPSGGMVVGASTPAAAPASPEPASASCVHSSAYAQYRSGYDHMVVLHNACAKSADCQVSTDVNPTPIRVTVAPGESETVLTFRGSPASVFKPTVNCRVAP